MKKKKLSKLAKAKLNENSRYWRRRALGQWSLNVRSRDKACIICGGKENLDAHHVLSAMKPGTKFESMNGVTVCKKHHKFSNECSFHKQSFVAFIHLKQYKPDQFAWIFDNINRPCIETFKQSYDRLVAEAKEKGYEKLDEGSPDAEAGGSPASGNSVPDPQAPAN